LSELSSHGLAGTEQEDFHVGFGFAQHPGGFGNRKVFGVMEPESLELRRWQHLAGELPKTTALFASSQQLSGVGRVGQFREFMVRRGRSAAVMVDAFAAGDGQNPGGEAVRGVELGDGPKGFDESVLGNLGGVVGVAAELGDEGVDAMLVALEEDFESREPSGLELASEISVGTRLGNGIHGLF
jgi:hypothetical protein